VELVKNSYLYWEFIRNLRNLDGVREGFIQQQIIQPLQHEQYMKQFSNCFYICLYNGEPAGYIGIVNDDIRVATHPDFQGKGVGSFMVKEICHINPNAAAKVKLDNEASLALFEKCGFKVKYYLLEQI
jgi:RimJ/RimL family protein N-acetyltransferase